MMYDNIVDMAELLNIMEDRGVKPVKPSIQHRIVGYQHNTSKASYTKLCLADQFHEIPITRIGPKNYGIHDMRTKKRLEQNIMRFQKSFEHDKVEPDNNGQGIYRFANLMHDITLEFMHVVSRRKTFHVNVTKTNEDGGTVISKRLLFGYPEEDILEYRNKMNKLKKL